MRILSAGEVRVALPMADAIDAMREAFSALADGRVQLPLRTHQELPGTPLVSLTMPGVITAPPRIGAKLLTINPDNPARALPAIHGLVVLFDPETGVPSGLLDGTAVTALRTGAVSGLATDLLARPDSRVLAVIGAGTQARTQLEAVREVRPIVDVRVWSRSPDRAADFAGEMSRDGLAVRPVSTVEEAVEGADVICTATPSTRPLVGLAEVTDGVHINAVGSYTREMCELGPHLVRAARVVVDSTEAAMEEAGELIQAVEEGLVDVDNFIELGELLLGRQEGRRSDGEITLFKSVGLAVQDLSAGARALRNAVTRGLGTTLDLDR